MTLLDLDSPEEKAKTRQDIADAVHEAIEDRARGLRLSPGFIAEFLEARVWEGERTLASGKKIEPVSFRDFIYERWPVGLGSTFEMIEEIISGHAKAVKLWEAVSSRKVNARDFIPLASIRRDGGTQSRVSVDDAVVAEYVDGIDALPPVVVFYDGTDYWLADGFHRVSAHERAGRDKVHAEVRQGDRRDAVLFSVGANAAHGLRRTNADKRRAVELLLRDEEWAKKSDVWIAERCGVGNKFVGDMRRELCPEQGSRSREGRDGKTRKLPERSPKPAGPAPVAEPEAPAESVAPGPSPTMGDRKEPSLPDVEAAVELTPPRPFSSESRTADLFDSLPSQPDVDESVERTVQAFNRFEEAFNGLTQAQRVVFFERVESWRLDALAHSATGGTT